MISLQYCRGKRHSHALLSFFLEFPLPFLRIDIAIRMHHRTAMKLFGQIHQARRANPVDKG